LRTGCVIYPLISALLLLTGALPVQAEVSPETRMYRGLSMEDLAETLLLEGLRFVQVPIDGKGMVANQRFDVSDGVEWSVLGYDCENDEGCSEIQLRSVFRDAAAADVVLSKLNDWNAANRFTRAYLGKGNAVILEMDIYLHGGQSLKNVREQITIWRQSVRRFSTAMTSDTSTP
jgi:Putative bacterial sensory transduction regulator